jgi:DNA gyrase subunit A
MNGSQDILVVSENGYGKKSKLDDYRITNRGGKGVKTINITPKTGDLIAIKAVTDNDDIMIINRSGILIRMAVADLRVMGRATQGVRLINIREGDAIASVARVEIEDEGELENIPEQDDSAPTDQPEEPIGELDQETGNNE